MNQNKPKKPPLTHFLCLPLINSNSLPQLESSLAEFAANIPLNHASTHPLIPNDAIRPVGTLHLTLGVMSLPSQERLDEALRFFNSLDLISLMREAEEKAIAENHKGKTTKQPGTSISVQNPRDGQYNPAPLSISLESLHALPRARSATVLHAAPIDPTGRLYPFCELLRGKMLEAGFIQPEYIRENRRRRNPPTQGADLDAGAVAGAHPAGVGYSEARTDESPANQTTLRPRPLLLHATVVNTIYVRGKRQSRGGHRGGKTAHHRHSNDRYTFDARDILSYYRNFYLDSDRVMARAGEMGIEQGKFDYSNSESGSENEEEGAIKVSGTSTGKGEMYPFIWARDFPINSVCICEMGAKKLDPDADADENGLNARLGEKYLAIAERSLVFAH